MRKNEPIKNRPLSQPKRIDFFKNTKSQHGVLHHFTVELQKALRRQGVLSSTYDILGQPLTEICARLAKDRPDCTIGFNVVVPEALFYETIGIPHVALIVDSATYYPELLQCPNTIASFAEMDSVEFLKTLQKKHLFFFPHAQDRAFAAKKLSAKKRRYDLLMPASYLDPEGPFSILQELFPQKLVKVFDDIIESALASPTVSHLSTLKALFDEHTDYQKLTLDKGIALFDVFNVIELTMRGRDRIRLVKAITDVDVHLACSKEDALLWKKALSKKKNIKYLDPIPYAKLYQTFLESRIVVSSIPTIKRGFHERMFLAASAGATTLTNASLYQDGYFPENRGLITYLSPDYKTINKKIEKVLKDESERLSDAQALKQIVLQDHTWDVRAQYLLAKLPTHLKRVKKAVSQFIW